MYTPSVPSTFVVAICGRAGACDQAAEAAAASPQARAARKLRFMSPPCIVVRRSAKTGRGPRLFPLDRACFAMLLGMPCLVPCKSSCPRHGALHFPMLESPRRIIHVDMDAFYASVEQRDYPELRGRPVAVGGPAESRGVVAAAGYDARAFGVRPAIPMARALRLCPELVVVRPDFARYRAVSQQVMAILRSCTPLVEPLSLDEAYLDVTDNLWGEPLASNVAKKLKALIREQLNLSASAGVAPNKFLAKIASGWKKPDGLTVIAPERVEEFLRELPVEALSGVGPVTAKKLRAIGIARLLDVRAAEDERLHRAVGSLAGWLKSLSRGEDPRPVEPDRQRKSLSDENTYEKDLVDLEQIRGEIERIARRTAEGLERRKLRARTVTIKVRYADFTTVTRSHTAAAPTCDAAEIAARALALLDRTDAARRPVRLLG